MRESIKATLGLVIVIAIMTMAFAWNDDRPNGTTWAFRTIPLIVALGALAVILRLHFQSDLAPDYLRSTCSNYFDRGGFCFASTLENMDGVCILHTYFQNRYDQPCLGKIAIRPAREFFVRPDMDTIAIEVECDGGAFGVHRMAIGIPPKLQGIKVKFEVGAAAHYFNGRGKMLRFRDAITLRADTEFANTFSRSLTIAAALGGIIVLSKPATATMLVPNGVAELIPLDITPDTKMLWRPGDEPI